jgi:hypothetical protein
MKEITDPGKKGHKKQTKQNKIHKMPTLAGGRKTPPTSASGEYAHSRWQSSRGAFAQA